MKSQLAALWLLAAVFTGSTATLGAYQNLPAEFAAGTVHLAGTLTLPDTPGPHPALVLIAGGQPVDQDCSYSGGRYKFFKIIAEALAERGIATLRYDSPGTGGSTGGDWNQRTIEDRAEEVSAGIQFLEKDKRVDAKRIGLLGHSEGTDVALIAAEKRPEVAYLALLSPHAKPLREAFLTFRSYLVKENGDSESSQAQADWNDFYAHTVFPAVEKGQTNWSQIVERGKTIAHREFDALPRQQQSKYQDFEAYFRSTVDSFYLSYAPTVIPHLQSSIAFEPLKHYERLRVPVLLVGGEKDGFGVDIPALAEAIRGGGNTDCTTRMMPKAGHTLDNPAVSQTQPVPELLPAISSWLGRVTAK